MPSKSVFEGVAYDEFVIHSVDKSGNRKGNCRHCDRRVTGSHGRYLAHFNPDPAS